MSNYGKLAYLIGHAGTTQNGKTEFFVARDNAIVTIYDCILVDSKFIHGDKLKVTICDRDADDTHTDVIIPGNDFIIYHANDSVVKVRNIVSVFNKLFRKQIKLNEYGG